MWKSAESWKFIFGKISAFNTCWLYGCNGTTTRSESRLMCDWIIYFWNINPVYCGYCYRFGWGLWGQELRAGFDRLQLHFISRSNLRRLALSILLIHYHFTLNYSLLAEGNRYTTFLMPLLFDCGEKDSQFSVIYWKRRCLNEGCTLKCICDVLGAVVQSCVIVQELERRYLESCICAVMIGYVDIVTSQMCHDLRSISTTWLIRLGNFQ
jgi:hypothetical protein